MKFNKMNIVLAGAGILGTAGTAILSARAATKVERQHLKGKEAVLSYILPSIAFLLTGGAIAASVYTSEAKYSEVVGALVATSTLLAEYRDGVTQEIGEEKEKVIFEKAKNSIDKTESEKKSLFIDSFTGAQFYSNLEFLRQGRETLNICFAEGHGNPISIGELYDIWEQSIPYEFLTKYDCTPDSYTWNYEDAYEYEYSYIHIRFVDMGNNTYRIEYPILPTTSAVMYYPGKGEDD